MDEDSEASGEMWHEVRPRGSARKVKASVESRLEEVEARVEARITEIRGAVFDINEAISSNINFNDRRSLENGCLIKTLQPMKLELKTLLEVFRAFFKVMPPTFLSQDVEFVKRKVYFVFDSKNWCGTVSCENSPYGKPNQSVLFTNIKLPNDSFLYMEEYCKGDKKTLQINETSETDEVVGTIVYSVCTQWSPHDVEVNYRFDEGRFEIYCWNEDRSRCVTVKFEYGTFEGYEQQGRYNVDRLKNFLNQMTSE
jgi:hypothetical protein